MWPRRVTKFTKKLGITHEVPAFYMLEAISKIVLLAAILLGIIAWAYTLPVIKLPGTYVGSGVVYTTNSSYMSFATKALDMGLDFMIIETEDPEVESRCIMDEKVYNFKCFLIKDGKLNGGELKICDSVSPDCEAIRIYETRDMDRAAISCSKLPPEDCILRPFPMWHRLVIPIIAIVYFLMSVASLLFVKKTRMEKVLELHRHISK